ncbi:MAG TPA: SDR family oxidoreductase [Longimicrobiaceae bacterium]|nr:SDR family oxidoreductase [Longimicrobiaceae bacterium]
MDGRVLVLGATGAVGRGVVEELVTRGESVRAASRDPDAARARAPRLVEWVRMDLERPDTFEAALAGVDRVFLIARPGDEEPERVAGPLIEAMRRAGTRHVVSLTALGVETRNDISLRKVELLLEESGLEYTHLRPNFFMQVFTTDPLLPAIRSTGAIRLPAGEARVSYIDARDIAAVAAAALTEPGHAGGAYTLTGPEALDHAVVAALVSEAAGARIRYEPATEEEARAALAGAGFPARRVERLIGFYRLVRAGFCAPVSGDVERVLGRPPTPFTRFADEHSSRWRVLEMAGAGR